MIETDDDHLRAACLSMVIDGPGGKSYLESVEASDTTGQAVGQSAVELLAMNPYVTAKFGHFSKGGRVQRTLTVKGDDKNDCGKSPDFSHVDGKGVMITRNPGDEGQCVLDVWHDSGAGEESSRHIARCVIPLDKCKEGGDMEVTLIGAPIDTNGDGDIDADDKPAEGKLKVKVTYSEEHRRLELEFGTAELPDIRAQHLCDALTFKESKIVTVSLWMFAVYIVLSAIFYDLYFRGCKTGPRSIGDAAGYVEVADNTANATGRLGSDLLASGTTNGTAEDAASETVANAGQAVTDFGANLAGGDGCEQGEGGWDSFLDAMVFQFSTFTTVGYGTHPVAFDTNTSMLLTVFFILSGMVILGVMAGALGQTLLASIDRTSTEVTLFVTHAFDCIQDRIQQKAESQTVDKAQKKQFSPIKKVLSSLSGMFIILFVGTQAYSNLEEDMSWVQALYFTVVTVTTVGFGDLAPVTTESKMFSVLFIPVGVLFFAQAISSLSDVPIRNRAAKLEAYVLNQFLRRLTTYDINALQRSVDLKETDPISKNDFSLAVLLRLGRVTQDDLERIESIFFTLDQDRSGTLTPEDLQSTHVLTFDQPSPRAQKAAIKRRADGACLSYLQSLNSLCPCAPNHLLCLCLLRLCLLCLCLLQ